MFRNLYLALENLYLSSRAKLSYVKGSSLVPDLLPHMRAIISFCLSRNIPSS